MKFKGALLSIAMLILFLILSLLKRNTRVLNYLLYGKNTSVIIINYARPYNLVKLIPELKKISSIKEIIVLHCNSKTYIDFAGVVNLKNFEDKYGGTERFLVTYKATYKNILFIDDDIVPSPELVETLQNNLLNDRKNLYGPFKRLCNKSGYFMNTKTTEYNIVLTPIMMTSKEIVMDYVANFYLYKDFLEKTHGNGEDLSINHFLKYKYYKEPKHVDGKYYYLDNKTASYSSKLQHNIQRQDFCKTYFG